jgi:hypothetical protein
MPKNIRWKIYGEINKILARILLLGASPLDVSGG